MYITKTFELENFCLSISSSNFVAIDTEFYRDTTYYPKLCLIQIATSKSIAIIDPLSKDLNLSILDDILQNNKIVKVFHSAKQDLEILYRLYGHLPKNIFDTQIAASFCGFGDYVSYENLVLEIVDKKIDKTQRISNWLQRPLTEEQIEYALGDVFYLTEIYTNLVGRLNHNERLSWALEEMQLLTEKENFIINTDDAWQKIKNLREIKLTPVLKALAKWREEKAIENDTPRNHYLLEKYLLQLADKMPIDLKELKELDGFHDIDDLTAKEIISVIRKSLKQPIENELEVDKEIDRKKQVYNMYNMNQLKKLLKHKSDKYQLPPQLLATSFELKSLYNDKVKKMPRFLSGWRYEIFGKVVLDIKKNTSAFNKKEKS